MFQHRTNPFGQTKLSFPDTHTHLSPALNLISPKKKKIMTNLPIKLFLCFNLLLLLFQASHAIFWSIYFPQKLDQNVGKSPGWTLFILWNEISTNILNQFLHPPPPLDPVHTILRQSVTVFENRNFVFKADVKVEEENNVNISYIQV